MRSNLLSIHKRAALTILLTVVFVLGSTGGAVAHPLGNFTTNHFTRIEIGSGSVKLRYVIDMAEIPTFQELRAVGTNRDGSPSKAELDAYAERVLAQYTDGLVITIDGERVPLQVGSKNLSLLTGAAGLQTMRIECGFVGHFRADRIEAVRRLRFVDTNYRDRIGWRELVVSPLAGISVFNSSAYGSSVTDELKAYPADMLAAPLDERWAEFSFTKGSIPSGTRALLARDGRPVTAASRDRLAELIAVPKLTAGVALLGLLIAVLLGGLHALSPGHGKTVVGAYLAGSRGTARQAAFLGLTVTITHTAGVFALGVATLLASEYVVPERLFPVLSLVSGAIVVAIGASLLVHRLRAVLGWYSHRHTHEHDDDSHTHTHSDHTHAHGHDHAGAATKPHSHGGRTHSHLPPGSDGSPVTWRSLLALGISGGILPCPSALIVLLAAISLHRVGYGLLLVVAFSVGLAGVLTAVGLAFVYAGRLLKSTRRFDRVARVLPIFSAFVIACAGVAICYEALDQTGLNFFTFLGQLTLRLVPITANAEPSFISVSALGVLGLGLVYCLKHASEVDHIVAVSAIVSEHRRLARGNRRRLMGSGTHRFAGDCRRLCTRLKSHDSGTCGELAGIRRRADDHRPRHGRIQTRTPQPLRLSCSQACSWRTGPRPLSFSRGRQSPCRCVISASHARYCAHRAQAHACRGNAWPGGFRGVNPACAHTDQLVCAWSTLPRSLRSGFDHWDASHVGLGRTPVCAQLAKAGGNSLPTADAGRCAECSFRTLVRLRYGNHQRLDESGWINLEI